MMYLEFRKPSILSLISFELHSRSKNKPKMIREVIKITFSDLLAVCPQEIMVFHKIEDRVRYSKI